MEFNKVKEKRVQYVIASINRLIFCLILAATVASVFAQSTQSDADGGQKRLKRARALMAAHKLEAAASELNAIRGTTTDDAVRDVARIMLMSIYLEEGDYMRAQGLLEETYKLRTAQDENSTRTYFALAGQAVNGAREHFSRYRSFGINIADKELPAEAASDLEHMRMLLERVAEQAREMCRQDEKCFDAVGLLEEAANMRGTLARNNQERQQWQREVTDARQRLAASETRIASISGVPMRPVSSSSASDTPQIVSNSSSAPNHSSNTSTKKSASAPDIRPTPKPAQGSKASDDEQQASASQNGKLLEIGSLIDKATQRVSPSYPQTAKAARVIGVVTVYLEIDQNGSVATVHRTNGPQLLRQAAEDAARRWKFRPTVVEGQPVRVMGFINFNFTL
jgi:TonB family protein